jgi:hypothetical protein
MTVHHSELIGMKDQRLRVLAPDATHQHFKGGLYRFIGTAMDAESGEPLIGKDGLPRVAYIHCYPYPKQLWIRDYSEWFGMKMVNGEPKRRFREIEGAL